MAAGAVSAGTDGFAATGAREGATDVWSAVLPRLRAGLSQVRRRDDSGQGLTEYALLLGGIFLVVFAAVSVLGRQVDAMLGHMVVCFQNFAGC